METGFSPHFDDREVRMNFVAKVYSVLFVQLAITCSVVFIFKTSEPVKHWLKEELNSNGLFIISFIGCLAIFIIFVCIPEIGRKVPLNVTLLLLMTLFGAVFLGLISYTYDTLLVFAAALTTLMVVATIAVMATMCSLDIASNKVALSFMGIIFIIGLFLAFPIEAMFKIEWIYTILVATGVSAFAAILIHNTREIMGDQKEMLLPEEYILGTVLLFTSIIYAFALILAQSDSSKQRSTNERTPHNRR